MKSEHNDETFVLSQRIIITRLAIWNDLNICLEYIF